MSFCGCVTCLHQLYIYSDITSCQQHVNIHYEHYLSDYGHIFPTIITSGNPFGVPYERGFNKI